MPECQRRFCGKFLKSVVNKTFNLLSVDGDTSTNDCVFLLANGGAVALKTAKEFLQFEAQLEKVCTSLNESDGVRRRRRHQTG